MISLLAWALAGLVAVLLVAAALAWLLVRTTPRPRAPLRVIRGDAPRLARCPACSLDTPTWPDADGPHQPPELPPELPPAA